MYEVKRNRKPTLGVLKDFFGVNKKEAAGFLLMLAYMEVGDEFKSVLGNITKMENETFKLDFTGATKNLVEIWDGRADIEVTKNPAEEIFK